VTADASALYNAGTAALDRGDLGQAVAFLAAAHRMDPRAPDVRRNLGIAERTVATARGESPSAPAASGPPLALSTAEGWWLAALLLALGAGAAIAAMWALWGLSRKHARLLKGSAAAALIAGALITMWLGAAAVLERRHPEAVIVVASVEARRGVDEAPRTPILMRAGERVRIGRSHGEDVEVILGGSPIGWVPRASVWQVTDTPRYTGRLRSK
jgi:hypothetical protein